MEGHNVYWAGKNPDTGEDVYVRQIRLDITGMTASEIGRRVLTGFIPPAATATADSQYGEYTAWLEWYVPVKKEEIEDEATTQRPLAG